MDLTDKNSYFTEYYKLNYSQVYPNRSIKYPELSNILQNAAANHADYAKLGFDDLQQYNQAWVMNRIRIEIDDLPKLNDEIEIDTWVELLRGPKSIRNLSVKRNGQKIIGVSSLWAVFNTVKRRPEVLALDSSQMQRFPDLHATSVENAKLEFDFEFKKISDYQVQLSDLDVVNHVNNIKYIEWCLDTLPRDFILENSFKVIEMNFLREIGADQAVVIEKYQEEKVIFFRLSNQENICFVLKIEY